MRTLYMSIKQAHSGWMGMVLMLSLMTLTGCASSGALISQAAADPSDELAASLDRIRYSELMAWQMLEEGGLLIELNNPRRSYILELVPSCVFELRQATDFIFAGKSANFISINDDVVVGNSRCRIVAIYETDQARQPQASATRRIHEERMN